MQAGAEPFQLPPAVALSLQYPSLQLDTATCTDGASDTLAPAPFTTLNASRRPASEAHTSAVEEMGTPALCLRAGP
jgi:hypothetical protein